MKCRLGRKKELMCENILRLRVLQAWVRGGWDHGLAQCYAIDESGNSIIAWVNYKTGEVVEIETNDRS